MKTKALLLSALVLSLSLASGCAKNQKIPEGKRQVDAAESSFAAGVGRAPTATTSYAFAKILVSQGRDRDAIYVLEKIVREHPKFVPAYNEIAGVYVRSDRVEDAIAVLNVALKEAPTDGVLHNNLGMCHMLRGDYEKSLESFTKAADAMPTIPAFRCNRATALALLGKQEDARKEYLTVLGLHKTIENLEVLTKVNPPHPEKDAPKDEKKVEVPPATQPVAAAEPAPPIVAATQPALAEPAAPVAPSPTVEAPQAEVPQAEVPADEMPCSDEIKITISLDPVEQETRHIEEETTIEPDCVTEPDAASEAQFPLDEMPCSDVEEAA